MLIFRTAILESIKTLLEARKKQEEVVMKVLHGWLKEQKVDVLVFVNIKYNRGKMNVLAVHICVEREIRMSESLCDDQVLG